jgi:hypothetical protein
MRIKYNLIFIPLLVIAALAVWFLTAREKKHEASKLLSDRALVNAEEINVVEIIRPDMTIRLEKSGEKWRLTLPIPVRANPDAFGKLLDQVLKMESERDITGVTPEQLTEYGLDNPPLIIKLASESKGVLMDLSLGKDNAQGTSRYALLGTDTSTCFLVPSYFLEGVDLTVDQIRDPHACVIDAASIEAFQVSSAESDIRFEMKDGSWYVTLPETFPASPTRMDILFQNIRELKAVEFLPVDAQNPELKTQKVGVAWTSSDGTAGWLKLLGEDYSRGVFATSFDQPTPFVVEAYIYDRLKLDPKDFYHVLLIDVPVAQISKVVVRQPQADNLEIVRTGGGDNDWRITKPPNRTLTDPGDFRNFLGALLAIEPTETVQPPEHAADYGFEPVYYMKIEVYGEGEDPVAVIYLGKQNDAGDYYATQSGVSYFTIDQGLIGAFITALDKLRTVPAEEKN